MRAPPRAYARAGRRSWPFGDNWPKVPKFEPTAIDAWRPLGRSSTMTWNGARLPPRVGNDAADELLRTVRE